MKKPQKPTLADVRRQHWRNVNQQIKFHVFWQDKYGFTPKLVQNQEVRTR